MRPILFLRAPRALPAALVALLGLDDIAVGAVIPHTAPVVLIALAPLGWQLSAVVCGVLLLLLANGLAHGRRGAWALSLLLLLQSAYAIPVEHHGRSVLALVPAAVLVLRRAHFGTPARTPRWGYAAVLASLVVFALAGAPAHHNDAGRHGHAFSRVARAAGTEGVTVGKEGAKIVSSRATSARGGASTLPALGLGTLLLLLGLRGLTASARPRATPEPRRARAKSRALFAAHGDNPVGYFAAGDDKTVWVDPTGRGVVAFRLIGATALVVGDPLTAPGGRPGVLDGFLAHCRRQGWTPAFYQTLGATLPLYRARGLRALAIGREAVIDLPSFTLAGKKIANVRHSVTHAERAGLAVRLYDDASPDEEARAALIDISRAWLASKRGGQMGFTMGRLSPDGEPSPGARAAVAYDAEGRAQAFITVLPAGGGRGWTLDLMRRRADAASGTMDLLIARTAEALRDEGYASFSLSLAPLASDAASDDEDAPRLARRARALLYEKMDGAYNYRSLFTYKKKFNVRWETRYLVYAGDAALAGAALAVARAHMPEAPLRLPEIPRPRRARARPARHAA
jgi:phosphatidylglycerol lysyltransferase